MSDNRLYWWGSGWVTPTNQQGTWRCSGCGVETRVSYHLALPGPGFCRSCYEAAKQ